MRTIPTPKDKKPKSPYKPANRGWIGTLVIVLLLGGVGFLGWQKRDQIMALVRPAKLPSQPFVAGARPLDTTPLAEPTEGWSWLFPESEWRVMPDERREYSGGLLRVRTSLEKTQPAADGVIRARVVIRDGMQAVSVVLRNTEQGRYRLIMESDLRTVRLVHETADKSRELGQYRITKLLLPGQRVTLELRAESDRLTASINGTSVIEVDDTAVRRAGTWGIESKDAWFELVEVPTEKPKVVAAAAPVATPEPVPVAPPAATPAPLSETAKWLATTDAQWQSAYQREVAEPFDKGVAELKKQYLAAIDGQLATIPATRMDDTNALRGERQRAAGGEEMPATDDAALPAALKQLRASYRAQFARLDKDRFDRAKALHAKYDGILSQNEAALTQRQRKDEAAELKTMRELLASTWLKPPVVVASAPTPARAPLGATPPPAAAAKIAPRQLVEKLLAMGAGVWVRNERGRMSEELKSLDELGGEREKFTLAHVELRAENADDKAITTADLAIIDHLGDVTHLGLHGPAVTSEIVAKLRNLRGLQILTLDRAKMSADDYAILTTLPELRDLNLRNLGSSDAAMKVVAQCRKLQRLELSNLPVSDEGLAYLGKLPVIEEFDLTGLDKVTSIGVNNLTEARTLKRLGLSGVSISTPVLEAVAKFNALESLTLSGNSLKDDQAAPLATMARLRSLNLSNTGVTGSVFTKWPVRTSMEALFIQQEAGIGDAALKALTTAFPRLQTLAFTATPLSATTAAYSGVGRMRQLRTLTISGTGVTDEVAAEIAKADDLAYLHIPEARLTDPGIAALSKLPRLTSLTLNEPPVTEAALKAFGKFKMLRTINVGAELSEEAEKKLRTSLTGITIRKPGGG